MKETIEFKGVEFEVGFDYQPYEAEVRYYSDGSGYPGCPESADVCQITHKGTCFYELMEDHFEDIEILILDKILE